MNIKNALLAGSVLMLPVVAQAQPISGLYVGAGAGAVFPYAEPNKGFTLNAPGHTQLFTHDGAHFNTAWSGELSVGWGFGNGLRAEVEGYFSRARLNYVAGAASSDGFENRHGGFVNLLYDVDLSSGGITMVQPYVGIGVGYLWANWQGVYAGTPPGQLAVTSTAASFAYQGIIGVAVPIHAMSGLALTADYRIMNMPFERTYHAAFGGPRAAAAGDLKMGQSITSTLMVGLRYAFNVAPPPPPPPPAPAPVAAPTPAPARTYLVFFDWDKADLTARARQIISEAAQNSTRVQLTRIEVNGYTDTSGSPKYNMGLSIRRAKAVAAELVKDGVPESAIVTQGFGDTHLLVPTGPGVREPQNRRVEIILK